MRKAGESRTILLVVDLVTTVAFFLVLVVVVRATPKPLSAPLALRLSKDLLLVESIGLWGTVMRRFFFILLLRRIVVGFGLRELWPTVTSF